MATTANAGSIFLAAAIPRLLNSANAAIILGTTSPLFHVNIAGVPDITSITISAQLIALEGTVTFGCVGGTLTSTSGNTCVLTYANMSANIATITATLSYRGQSFTSTLKITKVLDAASAGTNGLSNAIAYAYQRSATAPTLSPGDITYDFGLGGISFPTTLANGWLKTLPSGTLPLYVTTASASNTAATDAIAGTEWSGAVVLAQNGDNGTQGLSVATVYIYQRTTTSTAPTLPSASTVFTFSTAALTGLNNGWTTTIPAAAGGGFLWVSTATASNTTPTDTLLASEWAAAQLLSQDGTGVGSPGPAGNSVATVVLYQWSTVVPSNPTGVATFTWASASTTAYSASDGWSSTVPTNPGSPGIKLFLASVPITAPAGTTTSTCTFSGATIAAYSQNGATGAPGIKTATVSAYQWGLSAPTTTGTAVYTWTAGTYNTPPSTGWTAAKGNAPGSGYTLYEASVRLVESTGAGTSSVDWSLASVAGIAFVSSGGGAGAQGASAKRAYVLITGTTLALTPTTFTIAGTALPTTGTWGETNAWQATPPSPAAGQSVFQADGIFDPVTNQTVWNVPYLSNLKVGSLQALTAGVMGALTAGSIDLGTGTLSWHVDTSGNMWSGASTYTAAPFKVSTAGDVVMKSFLLQTPAGVTVLSSSGLAAGFEAPGTKNSDFSNGALTIGGDNLAVNSSFELFSGGIAAPYDILNNTSGTEPTTGSSGAGRTGGLAWIVSWTGAHSGTKGIYGPVCKGGWLPGAQYVLSFYAKTSDLAAGVPFGLIWTVPPASAVSLSNPTITTSWQRYSFLLTWGSSVEPNGYAYMTLGAGGGTHGNVWFDDLMAVEGSVLPAYYQSTAEVQSAINDSTSGLAQKMKLNAANILSGSGGLTTGTLTYDTSGARTGGYGVAMNQKGIVGFNSSGAATVTVDASTGEIALGGNCVISLGQSAYNTGTGAWLQGGTTPKMSMKTASGATFLCDPANNVLSMNGASVASSTFTDPVINTPILATQSVGGMVNVSTTGANGISRSITRTANPSGGRAPYTFLWVETTAGGMIKLSNTTSATVTITANGSSETQTGVVACTATDANGIAISGSLSVAMTFT